LAHLRAPEVLRIGTASDVGELNDWVHDAYLEHALEFSEDSARAVIPFAQESGWGSLHPSMPNPSLVRKTVFARHHEVPLTRCYVVVEHAEELECDIDWETRVFSEADYLESTFWLRSRSFATGVRVRVWAIDVRVLVTTNVAGRIYRKVLRGWPIESDRWLNGGSARIRT
jgi:hypothetical protein